MNHPVIIERERALARVRPLVAKTRKQAEEEVRRQREAAAVKEAERQAILEREAADARETRRLKLVTSAIGTTGAIGLIAIYFCAVVLR